MRNRLVQLQAISGLRVIGAGTATITITIGFRARGFLRRESACFGPPDGGAGETGLTRLTRATGDRQSVFTEALITVMATPETVTGADDGAETRSSTTPL